MSKSGQSSVTALNGKLSRKLRKSSLAASIDNGFKETLYGICKDMQMDVVPSVKILTGEPQPWILQQDTTSSLDASVSSKQSTSTPSKKTSKQVIELSLQGSEQEIGPTVSGSQEIQAIYPPNRTGIDGLICKNFPMSEHILGALQRTVGKFQTLRQIKLEFCRLTLDHLKGVKMLLVQNPNIVDVSLNGNDIQKEPYHILIKNTKVLYLQLKFCKISDKATLRIKDPLHVTTSQYLVTLNLSSNMITDIGAKHLAYALRTNRTLTHLNLSDNQITDVGAIALMSVLRRFPLEHEEIVVRRQKNLHNLLLKEEIRYDLTKTRKSDTSVSNKSEVIPKRSCSSARIRMAKGFDKSSSSSLIANQRRRSSADSSRSLSSIIEDKLPKDPDPFMHECFAENQEVYCRGNFHLQYLNLSYNKITNDGLVFIRDTLREQQLTKVPDETEGGLTKVVLEGNNIKNVDIVSSTSSVSTTSESGSASRSSVKEKKSLLSKIII